MIAVAGTCQSFRKKDTIYVAYKPEVYRNIAFDTITAIYNRQKTQKVKDNKKFLYLANHIEFNDLEFRSIPIFRIAHYAFVAYDCSMDFESFIVFEERLKYQSVIVTAQDREVDMVHIPDYTYLLETYYAGEDFTSDYADYVNRLTFDETNHELNIGKAIKQNTGNFFFQIFGLEDYLFDIDRHDHKMYAQYIGDSGGILYPGQTFEEVEADRHDCRPELGHTALAA